MSEEIKKTMFTIPKVSFQKDLMIEGQILRHVVETCGQFRHIVDNRLSRVLV
jgi:hypothetical protein